MHPTVNITLIWKLHCINVHSKKLPGNMIVLMFSENKRLEEKGHYAYLGEKTKASSRNIQD